jgi:cyclic pyranopterin phosphate synthase
MFDTFGRRVDYLRISATDRCDLRCVYCMCEDMTFLPKAEVLSLEELDRLCRAFVSMGVRKIRLTGGEPLVRSNVITLIRSLGTLVGQGLDELTLTTNGTQLARHAGDLRAAGVRRINVSLDTLQPERYRAVTRWGRLEKVMEGLAAAQEAGLRVKINAVALSGVNDDEFDDLVAWCGDQGFDLALIEAMPLGGGQDGRFLPLTRVRTRLERRWTLIDSDYRSGGPARYATVKETGRRIGFITPMSYGFCESCNRVRVTCTGTLYTCLGHEGGVDLRTPLRGSEGNQVLTQAIHGAIARKPSGHAFTQPGRPGGVAMARAMSITGG